MTKNKDYWYYLVAFVDILGQKEAFQRNGKYIDTIPEYVENAEKLKIVLTEADRQTVYHIEDLRKKFEGFFSSYTSKSSPPESIPKEKIAQYNEMNQCKVNLQVFSDSILSSVPLHTEKYHSNAINGIYGTLMACGSLLLYSLAMQKPFRVGIDIGLATELSNREIYGPALFRAYELESKKAQFPRIVIGAELINYLHTLSQKTQLLPNQTQEDIEWCRRIASLCLDMIKIDIDGCPILDYLGETVTQTASRHLKQGEYKKIYDRAHEFVKKEYAKWKRSGNDKLALRYHLLNGYFLARKPKN